MYAIFLSLCRQSWSEERKVLTDRVEECQARQVAVTQKLAESRKEAKKVKKQAGSPEVPSCDICFSLSQLQKHYKKQLHDLKQSSTLQAAQMEKLSTEKAATM